jgi:anti-sigma B factor antagonist
MGDGALSVDTSAFNGVAVVVVRVEVDAQTTGALSEALDQIDDTAHAALDLSAVEFMDSSGLYALLLKAGAMRIKGGSLAIRSASEPVRRLLHFTDLTSLLETNGKADG